MSIIDDDRDGVSDGRGRPAFEPTPDMHKLVQVLAGTLVPHATIARLVGGGIAVNTLKKYFAEDLEFGRENLVATLKAKIYRAADQGSIRAATWLLERLGGPEFAPRLRLGGDAEAVPIQVNNDAKVVVFLPDNSRDKPQD